MATYSFYRLDPRVRRYAETLARRGDHVDVFCLEHPAIPRHEVVSGVHVYGIQRRTFNEEGMLSYLFKTLLFLLRSGWFITRGHLRRPYDLIHTHNIPDFQVFCSVIVRLTGARVIHDVHDVVPELFASKFGKAKDSFLFGLLCIVERWSCRFADHVIVANDFWRERLVARSVKKDCCDVFLNYPDPHIFHAQSWNRNKTRPLFIYPGTLNQHQGLDVAIEAFAEVVRHFPTAEFHIYGDGSERNALHRQAEELRLGRKVFFYERVSSERIPAIMAQATAGIIPKRAEGFGNEAFSTKTLEFMSIGVPVIVSATAVDRHYFDDSVVMFFESGNPRDLADKMVRIVESPELRRRLSSTAKNFAAGYSWDLKKHSYLDLVDRLVSRKHATKNN